MKGHIRKRGERSWAVVVDFGRDPSTGKRRQKWHTVKGNKRDAERVLASVLNQLATGTYVEPSELTVEQYLEKWLQNYAVHNLAPKTLKGYKDIVRLHLAPRLGHIKLDKLQPAHIQAYYSWALNPPPEGRGLAPATVLYDHRVLSEALKHAVQWQMLSRNPCDSVKAPRVTRSGTMTLSAEELRSLLTAASSTRIHMPVLLAVSTGMRRGEVCGLRWEDVDVENGLIHVRHALQRIDGTLALKRTKTAGSSRPVALPESTTAALRKHRISQIERKLAQRPKYQDGGFVCAWDDGRPMDPDYVSKTFEHLTKRLGLAGLRFHDLRHTHVTLLLQEGVHPKIVAERLGHSAVRVTLDTYSHVLPQMQRDAADKINGLLNDTRTGGAQG